MSLTRPASQNVFLYRRFRVMHNPYSLEKEPKFHYVFCSILTSVTTRRLTGMTVVKLCE